MSEQTYGEVKNQAVQVGADIASSLSAAAGQLGTSGTR